MLTVRQVFDLGQKMAILADPRGKKGVERYLASHKNEFEKLSDKEQEFFDKEKLTNPYLDSTIYVDDGKNVKKVFAGIDMKEEELLLASRLNEKGEGIDLVITHHPVGHGLARLAEEMEMSVEVYESYGVPIHVAEKIHEERMKTVGRSLHPANHYKAVDVARLLRINYLSAHTLTDNLVDKYLRDLIEKKKPYTVGDVFDLVMEIPEYQSAAKMGFGPKIVAGSAKNRLGKYILEMTGGTEPSAKIYEYFSRAGFSTSIEMHMKEDLLNTASENHLNVVMIGHMSSDSLGMNLFLDELEKKGIEVVPAGGLIRVSRNKKKK